MKQIFALLIVFISISFNVKSQDATCDVINNDEISYRHEVHPKILKNEQQRQAGWSVDTPYDGCPNSCAAGNEFDCCVEMPCEKYQIPVVFTLFADGNCDGLLLGPGQLNAFITRTNNYYDCLGVPFELFKCTNWDQAGSNVLLDGSTRQYCNDDLSVFYTSSCADGTDPCCCDGDLACMANCNLQPDPFGDGTSDFSEAVDLNIPNVMNIYIPINYNGFTPFGFSEGGVAYFPAGDFSYGTSFGVNGIQNSSPDCNGTSGTTVSIHEFGHFFGLLHTHGAVNNAQVNPNDPSGNNWAECPDGSECCQLGDYICDTPPDPNTRTGNVENSNGDNISNCVINNGCNYDLSNCSSTCNVPYPSNFTNNNIMSYGTCDNFLSQCQIAKMVDALFCARNNLSCCDPNLVDSSTSDSYVSENTLYLCIGDAVPTFTINNPAGDIDNIGLNENCIGWYASDNNTIDFEVLGTGLSFTPPTTGFGAIDINTPGTYTYFFDDDLNNYSLITCQNDIRKQVTIVVTDDAGAGNATTTITDCEQNQIINISNNQALLSSSNNLVGWYLSTDDPTTTLNTATAIETTVNGASLGVATNPNLGEIFQANNGLTGLNGLAVNCDGLEASGGDGNYFITPFVAYEEDDIICSVSISGDPIDWNGGEGASAGPFLPISDCDSQGRTNYTFELVIEIGGCDEEFDSFIFDIKPGAACLSQQPSNSTIVSCDQSTFVFTEAMILAQFPNYDPFTNAFCLNALNAFGDFAGIDFVATLNVIYAGQSSLEYWNNNGSPNISTSNTNCFWGIPQEIICNCGGGDCFEIINYTVLAGDCDLTGTEIQLIDVAGAVLDIQTIPAGGSNGTFGAYFCGVYYLQLVNEPPCFTALGGSIGPELVNLNGEGTTNITFSPYAMIPTLSQWGLIVFSTPYNI